MRGKRFRVSLVQSISICVESFDIYYGISQPRFVLLTFIMFISNISSGSATTYVIGLLVLVRHGDSVRSVSRP